MNHNFVRSHTEIILRNPKGKPAGEERDTTESAGDKQVSSVVEKLSWLVSDKTTLETRGVVRS